MIPIIINNRNRVSTLKKLINCIPKDGAKIIILDNDSTFEPLLDYYSELPKEITLVKLNANLGHKALYQWEGYKYFKEQYFIYTDSDVVVCEDCPKDFLEYLLEAKKKYPDYKKIGLGLKIDDLPDHYVFKQKVIDWESEFWKEHIYDDELKAKFWIAKVDTTFAIYDKHNHTRQIVKKSKKSKSQRPFKVLSEDHSVENCLRTDFPYVARHLPWYIDNNNLDFEEKYYMKEATAKFITGKVEAFVGMWTHINKDYQIKKYLKHL